jgi:membrane protein DedA with SNARE-associated domain
MAADAHDELCPSSSSLPRPHRAQPLSWKACGSRRPHGDAARLHPGTPELGTIYCWGLAFAESLAIVSLLVPSTVLLLGIGALVGASGLEFWRIGLGATVSAILGDWLSYAIGYGFKHNVFRVWSLSHHPHLSDRGEQFIGPTCAVVPLVAGIFAMPMLLFEMASIASAFVWAFVMLASGAGLAALAK